MGEAADDLMDGTVCHDCGCFFVDSSGRIYTHGFPALCKDCQKMLRRSMSVSQEYLERYYGKKGVSLSEYDTL